MMFRFLGSMVLSLMLSQQNCLAEDSIPLKDSNSVADTTSATSLAKPASSPEAETVGAVTSTSSSASVNREAAASKSETTAGAPDGDASPIYIKVGEAKVKRSLLALPPFQYTGSISAAPNFKEIGAELFNTAFNDLDVSAYFEFISQRAYLEDTSKVGLKPAPGDPKGFNFENWKKIGTEFLVRAAFRANQKEVVVEGYLYHVGQAKLLLSKEFTGSPTGVRQIAHAFSDEIVKAIAGTKGIFKSRVVVASDRAGNTWREIYLMDWDARNLVKVSDHKSIALSPTWSVDGKAIAYTAYAYHPNAKTRNADLFSYDIATGKRFLLSSRPGINSGASYHPNGKDIYLTVSQGGNPDIIRINTDGEDLKKITDGPRGAMNVEPAVSPDGKKIAFSSDRSGQPMIYVMDIDGSNVKRLTVAGKYNASPAWAPDGKKLAFAGWDASHFDVFIVNPDGTGIDRLTSAKKKNGKPSNNEDPTFSPDGRHLMFISDRSGSKQIYIVNADGTNERRITTDNFNYYRPKWLAKVD